MSVGGDRDVIDTPGGWRVMQGEPVSPSGRFEIEVYEREVFNTHWAATPTIVDRHDRTPVFVFANTNWSCDEARWDGDRVALTLRKYPGNHTPADIVATIDCPGRTATVGGATPVPLVALEAALDAALTFHWARETAVPPPNPLSALLKRLFGG